MPGFPLEAFARVHGMCTPNVCMYQFIHTHMHAEYIHAHSFTHTHTHTHTQNAPHVEQLVLTSAAGLTGDELEKVSVCLCLCGVCGVCGVCVGVLCVWCGLCVCGVWCVCGVCVCSW